MRLQDINPGETLKIIRGCGESLPQGELIKVILVIFAAQDLKHSNKMVQGLVIMFLDKKRVNFPIVWDVDRFEKTGPNRHIKIALRN